MAIRIYLTIWHHVEEFITSMNEVFSNHDFFVAVIALQTYYKNIDQLRLTSLTSRYLNLGFKCSKPNGNSLKNRCSEFHQILFKERIDWLQEPICLYL